MLNKLNDEVEYENRSTNEKIDDLKRALEEKTKLNKKLEKENKTLSNKLYFKNVKALKNMLLDKTLVKSLDAYSPVQKLAIRARNSTQG